MVDKIISVIGKICEYVFVAVLSLQVIFYAFFPKYFIDVDLNDIYFMITLTLLYLVTNKE